MLGGLPLLALLTRPRGYARLAAGLKVLGSDSGSGDVSATLCCAIVGLYAAAPGRLVLARCAAALFGFLARHLWHDGGYAGGGAADVGPDARGLAVTSTITVRPAPLISAVLVFAYLAVVLYIGIFAFRAPQAAGAKPRTTSSRAARSGRSCSCCRSSART